MNGLKSKNTFRLLLFLFWLLGSTLLGGAAMGEEKTFVFPEMSGWKQDGEPQVFSPRTLYEYIDGAADLYLTYEFQDLNVAEYKGEGKAAVTVEVYRHGDSTQAFGIYSQERLANARFLDIGAQGYQEPNVLNFVAGPYYVKISGYSTGAEDERTMLTFGRKMEEILGGKIFPSRDPLLLSAGRHEEEHGKVHFQELPGVFLSPFRLHGRLRSRR